MLGTASAVHRMVLVQMLVARKKL